MRRRTDCRGAELQSVEGCPISRVLCEKWGLRPVPFRNRSAIYFRPLQTFCPATFLESSHVTRSSKSRCGDSRLRLSSRAKPGGSPMLCVVTYVRPRCCRCSCLPHSHASDCIPIHEASQHVGETKCVAGKVLKVKVGAKGVHFLDFCEDQMACPFIGSSLPFRIERCRRRSPPGRPHHRNPRSR